MKSAYPQFSLKPGLAIKIILSVVLGKERSFRKDALEFTCGISSLRISGPVPDPERTPHGCLLVVNHYHRPGFHSWWIALAVTAAFPVDLHWVMTDTYTYPDRLRSAIITPLSTWFLRRLARMYGFTSMPPMPPRPQDQAARGQAARVLIRYVRETRRPMIGFAPEGRDSPDGSLLVPPPGVGKLVQHLASQGLDIIPAGIYEKDGALQIQFGGPVENASGLPGISQESDAGSAGRVMRAIAGCLPEELRAGWEPPTLKKESEPCSELRFGN